MVPGVHWKKGMKIYQITMIGLLGTALLLPVNATAFSPQAPQPDNTAVNKRDRKPGAKTADQQKMNAVDRELTAKIRRAVMADKTLSMNGHNVKIVSADGKVTLKGPVDTEAEVKSIMDKAIEIAGSAAKVTNEMSVMPAAKSGK
jgi:hyperosmotically inducible periplasmic protein